MRIAAYRDNAAYLKDEFTHCPWQKDTGMESTKLEGLIRKMWHDRGNVSTAIARAQIQRFIVEHAQIELNPHTLFPGKLNHGIVYSESGSDQGGMFCRLFHSIRDDVLEKEIPVLAKQRIFAGKSGLATCESDFWHIMPDWQDIIRLGFPGLKARAEEAERRLTEKGTLSSEQKDFFESVRISLDTIYLYMDRMIAYAEKISGTEEYLACMKAIRVHAPETLYEVMMVSLIYVQMAEMGVERIRTLGIIDQMYYPYYKNDINCGRLTKEDVKELLRYFFGRWSRAGRFAAQPFTICGVDENGHDAGNDFTDLILDVYDEMDILDPKIHVRWHEDFDEKRLRKLLSMVRSGHSAILFLNDETVYRAYEKIGVDRELSRSFVPFGCYEPVLMGYEDAMIGASWLNIAKSVEYLMNGGRDAASGKQVVPPVRTDFKTFDEVYDAYLAILDEIVDNVIRGIEIQNGLAMKINPSPLYSMSVHSCVERGKDAFDGGMRMNNVSVKCFGIGTAADSLAAIRQLVFEEKIVSFEELCCAVQADWQGYEELRIHTLNLKQKFGNHEPITDGLAKNIYKHLFEYYVGRPSARGGVYRMGGDSINYSIYFGQTMWATPDGRHKFEIMSKNFGGTPGMEKSGLTASMLSALSIDHSDLCDACVYDFIAHPSALEGEKGLDAMESLLRIYFEKGGFALHGNVLQPDQLKDAREHPEKYPNLQVRLCGWNEYFVQMAPEAQEAFIRRLEVQ